MVFLICPVCAFRRSKLYQNTTENALSNSNSLLQLVDQANSKLIRSRRAQIRQIRISRKNIFSAKTPIIRQVRLQAYAELASGLGRIRSPKARGGITQTQISNDAI